MLRRSFALLVALFAALALLAEDRAPISPGFGSAVLVAKNSIQLDRDVSIRAGDVIVNNAATAPLLGEAELSLDQGVTTAAGYKLAADRIDIDRGAVVRGDVWYNRLKNDGTIQGGKFKPLALPVFANLPAVVDRTPGTNDVFVAIGATVTLAEGDYGRLIAGRGATVILSGGGYAFASIIMARDAALSFVAPSDVSVRGNVTADANVRIIPRTEAVTPASILFHVNGSSVSIGQSSTIEANIQAAAATLVFGQKTKATGAFFANNILAARGCRFRIANGWNAAPTADPQTVFTNGAAPLPIVLHGSDPDGSSLTYSIVVPPSNGTLGTLSGSHVTYTPSTGANLADTFTFRVTDPAGAFGDAVVTINPQRGDPPPPPVTRVIADDLSASVVRDTPTTLVLTARAPDGVTLTFTTTGVGPFHGTLGAITAAGAKMANVVYTPDEGYVGPDSFEFKACGGECDTATFGITVLDRRIEPPGGLVHDVNVSAVAGTDAVISLGGTSTSRFVIRPEAAILVPVTIAGNVADANGDGIGDNHNALPGPVPVFMSAGSGLAGGAGSNGKVRMNIEFDISGFGGSMGSLVSAELVLHTHRGTIDAADTRFYWVSTSNDGLLTDADFARPAEPIPGVVMKVPSLNVMPVGAEGTFSFSIYAILKEALAHGLSHLTIQGRVDESLPGPVRGLEVRTTADDNITAFVTPQVGLATPGVTPPTTYSILTLPLNGVLHDSHGVLITNVPYALPTATVVYTPLQGFVGNDSFHFSATNGILVDEAIANIHVTLLDCRTDPRGCDNGR